MPYEASTGSSDPVLERSMPGGFPLRRSAACDDGQARVRVSALDYRIPAEDVQKEQDEKQRNECRMELAALRRE